MNNLLVSDFVKNDLGSIILLVVLVAIIALIVVYLVRRRIRNKKNGTPSCNCGCPGCGKGTCHSELTGTEEKKEDCCSEKDSKKE